MYLTCPVCHFTVSEAAAPSPFQNCPRCLLRSGSSRMMVVTRESPHWRMHEREAAKLDRIAEAKARLSPPARGADWA